MFHTQEAPLPPPKLPWLQRLSSTFQIISDCLYCCSCCLFGFFCCCFNFLFCVGIMNLKPTKDLEHVSVPWAASTNYHKFRWLKIAVIYCLQFWSPEIWYQDVGKAFYKVSKGGSFLSSSYLGVPWLVDTLLQSLPPLSHDILLVSVFISKFPSSYKDNSRWIRANPNQAWLHLNLIRSAETLFPNKVTFTRAGTGTSTYILGRHSSKVQ